jgi:hypothetical protein
VRFVRILDSERAVPLGALLGVAGWLAVAGAVAWLELGLPIPGCAWNDWTGIPCPTCGSTRLVRSLSAGRWLEAFAWNPAIFVALAGVTLWAIASAVRRMFGWPVWRPVLTAAERLGLGIVVAVGILANWAWLILRGA